MALTEFAKQLGAQTSEGPALWGGYSALAVIRGVNDSENGTPLLVIRDTQSDKWKAVVPHAQVMMHQLDAPGALNLSWQVDLAEVDPGQVLLWMPLPKTGDLYAEEEKTAD